MTSPGNQELLEMIQALEQKVIEQQRKIQMLEGDLNDIDNRSNRLIERVVTKEQFNTSMRTFAMFGIDDYRGRL